MLWEPFPELLNPGSWLGRPESLTELDDTRKRED